MAYGGEDLGLTFLKSVFLINTEKFGVRIEKSPDIKYVKLKINMNLFHLTPMIVKPFPCFRSAEMPLGLQIKQ